MNNGTGTRFNFTLFSTNEVSIGVSGGPQITVQDGYLSVNGNNTFYAGHNAAYDPNGFSRGAYQLLARQNNSSPLRVRVNDNNSTVSEPRKRLLMTGCGSGFARNSYLACKSRI